jgi:hypothetical protein
MQVFQIILCIEQNSVSLSKELFESMKCKAERGIPVVSKSLPSSLFTLSYLLNIN